MYINVKVDVKSKEIFLTVIPLTMFYIFKI